MAKKRVALEMGMGTDLRGEDMTKAACRAVKDALQRNSLTMAHALDLPKDAMIIELTVGVPKPDEVNLSDVCAVCPYGDISAKAVEGGLSILSWDGEGRTTMASAAIEVFFDIEEV